MLLHPHRTLWINSLLCFVGLSGPEVPSCSAVPAAPGRPQTSLLVPGVAHPDCSEGMGEGDVEEGTWLQADPTSLRWLGSPVSHAVPAPRCRPILARGLLPSSPWAALLVVQFERLCGTRREAFAPMKRGDTPAHCPSHWQVTHIPWDTRESPPGPREGWWDRGVGRHMEEGRAEHPRRCPLPSTSGGWVVPEPSCAHPQPGRRGRVSCAVLASDTGFHSHLRTHQIIGKTKTGCKCKSLNEPLILISLNQFLGKQLRVAPGSGF